MSEEEIEQDEDITEERKELIQLGVKNTWNILISRKKRKEETKEKSTFRGFK